MLFAWTHYDHALFAEEETIVDVWSSRPRHLVSCFLQQPRGRVSVVIGGDL